MGYATGSGTNPDYSNQTAVPDFEDYFARWRGESERVRAARSCILDVPYGAGLRQTIDIFPSDAAHPAPVFVFIHGGWWYFLDKKDHSFIAEAFLDKGCTVALVGYPLAPAASVTDIVESVRKSLAWIHANIARFGGDPGSVHIAGHSAGGHLTAMMMATDWSVYGLPRDFIKSGCPVSGLFDLGDLLDAPQNRSIRMLPEVAAINSPISLVPKASAPMVLCVGGAETKGFLRQHEAFKSAWSAPQRPVEDASIAGENHFSIIEHLGRAGSPLFKAFVRHLCK